VRLKHFNAWRVCCLHLAGAVLPAISPKVLARNTNFRRYGFVPRYRMVRVWFTKISFFMQCNRGNSKQDSSCWVQTAHKSCGECFNCTSFCIWVKGTQIWAIEAVFAKVTIILPPLYGPTVLVLLYSKTKFPEGFSGPLWYPICSDILKSSKPTLEAKARRSLFTETRQKRPTRFGFERCFELAKMSLEVGQAVHLNTLKRDLLIL